MVLPDGVKAYNGNGKYVFISYSHQDSSVVIPIIEYLQKRGYNVWFDEGIVPGSDWTDFIAQRILDCSCFVGFISSDSVASPHCKQEIYLASDEQKDIISVLLGEVELPPGLRMKLTAIQAIDKGSYSSEAQFFIKLLESKRMEECKDTEEFQMMDDALVKYNGKATDVRVPDTVGRIAYNAFEGCDSVSSVYIPSSVNMIGKYAFHNMRCLESITVSEDNPLYSSREGILFNRHRSALLRCPPQKEVGAYAVPDGVKMIDMLAFADVAGLAGISMPHTVRRIGARAFEGCRNLIDVELSPNIEKLRPYTFNRCTSLIRCVVPDSVKELSDAVFDGCVNLLRVELPHSLLSMGDMCFAYCSSLREISIPPSVREVPPYCFYECLGLLRADLGGVSEVREYAFKNCLSLEQVAIPDTVASIGRAAFSGCASLSRVRVPGSVKVIGSYAFDRSPNLCELTIEEGVVRIEAGAFAGDTSLKRVVLPESVCFVDPTAFPEWTELAGGPGSR